jgi:hypothetical protein
MIVGKPRAGRKTATLLLITTVMIIVITLVAFLRKKTAPVKEPPLHPSTVFTPHIPFGGDLVK